jgi:uncharacterized membrane protein HdeD (DUF308 family)
MATALEQLTARIEALPDRWWLIALRGVAAIVFGFLAFFWPGLTLTLLVLFFGVYAIVDGVLALFSAFHPEGKPVWLLIIEGIVGIVAGFVAFSMPGLTTLVLLYIIAAWAIITGAIEIATAIRLRQVVDNEWAMGIAGALSILFGVLLVIQPGSGVLAVVWLIGIYAVLFGISLLVLAWRLHGLRERIHHHGGAAPMPGTTMP